MRRTSRFTLCAATVGGLLSAVFWLPAQEHSDPDQAPKEVQAQHMPPRVGPTDYQAHAQAGTVTIGAEFMGHSVPTPEHIFSTEDYIVVEAGFFGPSGAQVNLAREDFSLRVNDKKLATPSAPYELVLGSLKDPEWQPPESKEDKEDSKSSFSTGGNSDKLPPLPPKMPFPLKRAMQLQVQKAAMEIGDRPLPVAGLLFFPYRGKAENIHSLELIYSGAAGKATLTLQP